MLLDNEDLRKELEGMRRQTDERFRIVFETLDQLLSLESKAKRKIGFEAKEPKACPVKFLPCEMPALLNVGPIPLGFSIFHRGETI